MATFLTAASVRATRAALRCCCCISVICGAKGKGAESTDKRICENRPATLQWVACTCIASSRFCCLTRKGSAYASMAMLNDVTAIDGICNKYPGRATAFSLGLLPHSKPSGSLGDVIGGRVEESKPRARIFSLHACVCRGERGGGGGGAHHWGAKGGSCRYAVSICRCRAARFSCRSATAGLRGRREAALR